MSTNKIEDGGPAFPCDWKDFVPTTGEQVAREQFFGITARDYFAGQALCGWAAGRNRDGFCETSAHDVVAQACYRYADAMLKARSQ